MRTLSETPFWKERRGAKLPHWSSVSASFLYSCPSGAYAQQLEGAFKNAKCDFCHPLPFHLPVSVAYHISLCQSPESGKA